MAVFRRYDPHLFVAYGSGLFAQDEMQVAEHPVLGALKEALTALGSPARTKEEGRPTPILVMGAERRCHVATDRNAEQGRPFGLYGNAFAGASAEAVRRARTRIDPPAVTNLVAIAAPSGVVETGVGGCVQHVLQQRSIRQRQQLLGSPHPAGCAGGQYDAGEKGAHAIL